MDDITKKFRIHFSEENRLRNINNKQYISSLHKRAFIKNSNTCFNKSNLPKEKYTNNNLDIKEYNNFILTNKNIITPIKIQYDASTSKYLPMIEMEKLKNIKESLNVQSAGVKTFLKKNNKNKKIFLNKSYFLSDKLFV